jgi:hypothetical protein
MVLPTHGVQNRLQGMRILHLSNSNTTPSEFHLLEPVPSEIAYAGSWGSLPDSYDPLETIAKA